MCIRNKKCVLFLFLVVRPPMSVVHDAYTWDEPAFWFSRCSDGAGVSIVQQRRVRAASESFFAFVQSCEKLIRDIDSGVFSEVRSDRDFQQRVRATLVPIVLMARVGFHRAASE